MDRARLAMLEQRWLHSGQVDREYGHVVLAAIGDLRAREVDDPGITVGHIDELSRGMDVDRAGSLPRADVAGIGKGRRDKYGVGREKVIRVQFVDIQLILALDRDEHPRLPRMEIEVSGPKAEAGAGRDRRLVRQHAVGEAEDLECTGILRLALPSI